MKLSSPMNVSDLILKLLLNACIVYINSNSKDKIATFQAEVIFRRETKVSHG